MTDPDGPGLVQIVHYRFACGCWQPWVTRDPDGPPPRHLHYRGGDRIIPESLVDRRVLPVLPALPAVPDWPGGSFTLT